MGKKEKNKKLVEVIWQDTIGGLEDRTITDLEKEELPLNRSVGFLIKKDKKKLVLAFMTFGFNHYEEVMKHWQVIPRGMVQKITELKKK